jgi:hypothetical protein
MVGVLRLAGAIAKANLGVALVAGRLRNDGFVFEQSDGVPIFGSLALFVAHARLKAQRLVQ